MNRKKLKLTVVLMSFLLICAGLTAGASTAYAADGRAEALRDVLSASALHNADKVTFPDGQVVHSDETSLRLKGLKHDDLDKLSGCFEHMPRLTRVDLGSEENEDSLTVEDVSFLIFKFPSVEFDYTFDMFGKKVALDDEVLDFNHVPMDDNGEKIVSLMKIMRNPKYLDLDFAGIDYDVMAKLREDYPECDVVWRVWIGTYYSIRTDAERFVGSEEREILNGEKMDPLKYCTNLKYLDIGHNEVEDISFISGLENLEVAIICLNTWTDASPLAGCKKLRYLEMNDTNCHDLSPLGGCESLEHLNVGRLHDVTGWESLKKLKNLKRLWITRKTRISEEELAGLQHALPDTEINTTNATAVLGSWRYEEDGQTPLPRYEQLIHEMGYDINPQNQSYYYHDKTYYPEGYINSRMPVPFGYKKSE